MSFCRVCGEKSSAASLFCGRCGYRLQASLEEVTSHSDPHTTHISEAPTLLTRPLQNVPTNNVEKEEEEERRIIPLFIPPEAPATGNVPSVAGAPQVGTVPSISGGGGTGAATRTAGTMAKALLIAALCVAVVFAGVKVLPPILLHPTTAPTASVPVKATTVPVPPTQTSCPQAGTARAAVTSTLVLGTHQDIVYVENNGQGNVTSGTLWRYDITSHQRVRIVQIANGGISYPQISADGQWVLFASNVSGQSQDTPLYSKLQMVRLDGQGLQTLYCSASTPAAGAPSSINNIVWSPDQHSVAFVEEYTSSVAGDYYPAFLHILNASNGKVQKLTTNVGAAPPSLAWLDNTHIYMLVAGQATPEGIYLLDTTSGGNASKIVPNSSFTSCLDFAGGYDGTKLFVSQCAEYIGQTGGSNGQSSITERPATGGTPTTIYNTPTLAITWLRLATTTSLLLLIENQSGDMSHNGLWKINMDGTGLTQLASDPVKTGDTTKTSHLNGFSRYPWANVSRDGRWYALEQNQTLIFGSMSGGLPTAFATLAGSNATYYSYGQLKSGIVGWTSV
jgi:hypothetical protein